MHLERNLQKGLLVSSMYYSSIGALSIILHVIINADMLFRKGAAESTKVGKAYRHFLFAVMLYYTTDFMWGILLDTGVIPLVYIDTVLYFLAMGLTVFLWVRYIAIFLDLDNKWTNILKALGWIVFASEALALIINNFVPIMFTFTTDGEYVASSARYVILYVQVVIFAMIAIDTLVTAKKQDARGKIHHHAIGISGLIMAFFVFLQAQFPMMPFYAIGCLFATCIIHTYVVIEEQVEYGRKLGMVMTVAYKDPLTNVRNINAYSEFKENIENDVRNKMVSEFAVVVFDLNDLKKINDTKGHEAGDAYIKDGCALICRVFSHSPVFRIGGDEFVAFLTNDDYANREDLFRSFNEHVERNLENSGVVVSAGLSLYDHEKDSGYDEVFARADVSMYERKKELKSRKPAA